MSNPQPIHLVVDGRQVAEAVRQAALDADGGRGATEDDIAALVAPWSMRMKAPSAGWLSANGGHGSGYAKARLIKVLRRSAYLLARSARVPQLQSARIVIVFHHRDRRRRDVANLAPTAKAVIDGLVDAGLLPDDDDAHLTGPDLRTGAPVTPGQWPSLTVLVYPRSAS